MKLDRQLGLLLAGIWLLAHGLTQLINLRFDGLPIIMAILAMAAGALLVLRR
jgi:hypothetical protein